MHQKKVVAYRKSLSSKSMIPSPSLDRREHSSVVSRPGNMSSLLSGDAEKKVKERVVTGRKREYGKGRGRGKRNEE